MKIATYNVWNEEKGAGIRRKQLIHEIRTVDADIIGLQEVTPDFYQNYLQKETGYPYSVFEKYHDEEEGLAILSRFPLRNTVFLYEHEEFMYSVALHVSFEAEGMKFSLTNVHLPWDSVKKREEQIVAMDAFLHANQEADFFLLLGDFNSDTGSGVDRFLRGEQTLNGAEANPCWNDLASAYAARCNEPVKATLDVVHNPRWAGTKSIYTPEVMDRIYLMDHWYETKLESVRIFGTEVSPETNLAPSDHYGVVAEVMFKK